MMLRRVLNIESSQFFPSSVIAAYVILEDFFAIILRINLPKLYKINNQPS